jgi:serine phosphatase RsbU (regulator of sigma subunit)
MNCKKIFFVIAFIAISIFSIANTETKLDSLKNIIQSNVPDTTRLETLNEFAYAIRKINTDTAAIIGLSVIEETQKLIKKEKDSLNLLKLKSIQLRAYSNMFVFYRKMNTFLKAIDLHSNIYNDIDKYQEDISKARFYSDYAEIFVETGKIKSAISYYNKARDIFQKINDTEGLAGSYYNMGKIMYWQEEYEKSIVFAENALETLKSSKNVILSSYCFNLIANSYSSIANKIESKSEQDSMYELGVKYYLFSLKIKEEYNDIGAQVITLNNLASIEYTKKDYDAALDYLEKSLKLSIKLKDDRLITNTYITFASVYISQEKYDEALFYANNAYILSKNIDNMNFRKHASKYLNEIYKNKNDYKKALEYYEVYTRLKDSTMNKEFVAKVLENEQNFEYKKKHIADSIRHTQEAEFFQLELQKKEAQIDQKKVTRNWLFTAIIFLAIVSFSIYRNYKNQYKARKALASKNIQIKKQNEILEEQKQELNDTNKSLSKAYQDKVDSIKFAKKIQATTFPTNESIQKALPESFIVYKPLDIVSGDFYWVSEIDNKITIAVGDSTGHGVPGAFMSILGIAILKERVNSNKSLIAADILDDVRESMIETLRQYSRENVEEHYGMDLGIIIYDKQKQKIQYSGAFTPLYIVRNPNELKDNSEMFTKVKGDKMPISLYPKMDPYTNHEFDLNKGDMFYMFTDGTTAQHGGDNAKKLGSKLFADKLIEVSLLPIDEQKKHIEKFISDWKVHINPGTGEHFLQTDDITILGVRA